MVSLISELYIVFIFITVSFIILSICNLLNLLIYMEVIWVSIFLYLCFKSQIYDSMFIFIFSLYCLCLATAETTIGLAILILKLVISNTLNNTDGLNNKNYFFLRKSKKKLINGKIK